MPVRFFHRAASGAGRARMAPGPVGALVMTWRVVLLQNALSDQPDALRRSCVLQQECFASVADENPRAAGEADWLHVGVSAAWPDRSARNGRNSSMYLCCWHSYRRLGASV